MGAAVAELRGVGVAYGGRPVLADVDLRIEPGELLAIVGPSGAGKSTLLRVLASLREADSGQVLRPEAGGGSTRVVFQAPHLLPWRSVSGNVRIGLEYRANGGHRRRGRADANAQVATALDELGIADLANRRPGQLSGGQAQRVAVARAVVANPSLLLLDEPFGALDPLTRADAQEWLRGVRERLGIAMLLITHDLEEALYLGDRVGLLHAAPGPLEFLDSPVHERADLADGTARAALLHRFTSSGESSDLDSSAVGPGSLAEPEPAGASRRQLLTVGGAATLLAVPAVAAGVAHAREVPADAGDDAPGADPAEVATLRIGYLPITDASPLLLAHADGDFASRGIDVPEPTLFRGWAPLVEALQGGQVDIVHLLMPLAIQLRYGAGVPVKVLGWNHTNGSALAVAHDVDDLADLAGTTFAVPGWYSVHNVVFQKMLRDAGLEPVIDTEPGPGTVQLVVLPPADMPTALEAGTVSGYIVAEPFCAVAEVQGIGKILRFTGDVWKDHACCVTVVHERLVTERPDVAARALEAIVAAQLRIRDDRHTAAVGLSEGGYLPQPLPAIDLTLTEEQDPAYVTSGAVQHPEWESHRIDFQPYPFPGYTAELVDAMRETTVDDSLDWLDAVETGDVHADLVATDLNLAAIESVGGLAAFGVGPDRVEVIAP
ncbi:ABC transporter substrate-binding protein [Occultella glacieicola]|uniref:ABC transporter substrate-binding protein n=1 Tax=Occultella glacieicola TaxID=2518684 RepID=UPI001404FBC0|nr:ABC transporter substrate-binding protein [Occultella glacieicola]